MPKYSVRLLSSELEVEAINSFIHAAAAQACQTAYSPKQIYLLNRDIFGIHPGDGALEDQSFFVIESVGKTVATGGWSKRKLKHNPDEDPFLIPGTDPARIRTFFVDPDLHHSGLGSLLMQLCENAALEAGFNSAILYATLNGEGFYAKHGYTKIKSLGYGISAPLLEGEKLEFIYMQKSVLISHDFSAIQARLDANGFDVEFPTLTAATSKLSIRKNKNLMS